MLIECLIALGVLAVGSAILIVVLGLLYGKDRPTKMYLPIFPIMFVLAMNAADAARNTSALIEGTIGKIREGAELAAKTHDEFSSINEGSQKISGLIGKMAAASQEQAQGIGQISQAIGNLGKVVQQNTTDADIMANTSDKMN